MWLYQAIGRLGPPLTCGLCCLKTPEKTRPPKVKAPPQDPPLIPSTYRIHLLPSTCFPHTPPSSTPTINLAPSTIRPYIIFPKSEDWEKENTINLVMLYQLFTRAFVELFGNHLGCDWICYLVIAKFGTFTEEAFHTRIKKLSFTHDSLSPKWYLFSSDIF